MAKHRCWALSASLALFVTLGAAVVTCGGPGASAPTANDACPHRTPAEWQAFVDRWAADSRWARTCAEGACDEAFYRQVDEEVRGVFEKCAVLLARSPGIDACTANLRRFTPRWMEQHSPDSYGFTVDNRAYFAAQEGPGAPAGMMTPPPELVAAVPDVEKVTAAARAHGWKYVEQASCLGGSRLFVLVSDPGGRFDQWTLLNLADDLPGPGAAHAVDVHRTMPFIAVQKKDAAGAALPRVRLHFRDYTLTPDDGGAGYSATLAEVNQTKCYACHPSGVRRLAPRRSPLLRALPVQGDPGWDGKPVPADFAFQRLTELNARLGAYGLPDWNGLIVAPSFGPVLGKGAGCVACHDGRNRGILTIATSQEQLDLKVDDEVGMPPDPRILALVERDEMKDPPLTAEEKGALESARTAYHALAAQVQASRAPALRAWLGETRCR